MTEKGVKICGAPILPQHRGRFTVNFILYHQLTITNLDPPNKQYLKHRLVMQNPARQLTAGVKPRCCATSGDRLERGDM
jgi:hypothetical protein